MVMPEAAKVIALLSSPSPAAASLPPAGVVVGLGLPPVVVGAPEASASSPSLGAGVVSAPGAETEARAAKSSADWKVSQELEPGILGV